MRRVIRLAIWIVVCWPTYWLIRIMGTLPLIYFTWREPYDLGPVGRAVNYLLSETSYGSYAVFGVFFLTPALLLFAAVVLVMRIRKGRDADAPSLSDLIREAVATPVPVVLGISTVLAVLYATELIYDIGGETGYAVVKTVTAVLLLD